MSVASQFAAVASVAVCHVPYCEQILHFLAGHCADAQDYEAVSLLAQKLVKC